MSSAADTSTGRWPVSQLKNYPLDKHWTPDWPKKRASYVGYQKTMGSVRALAIQPEYEEMVGMLRNYCFQQGEENSNASSDDREMFEDILANDFLFFVGDQDRELVQDFPLDPKAYDTFPHMKSSHFDFYRVERRGWFGAARLHSLTKDVTFNVKVPMINGPVAGEVIFGRVMSIGFSLRLTQCWIVVPSDIIDNVLRKFDEEFEAMKKKFSQLTKPAFLKIAAYHVYEYISGCMMIQRFEKGMPNGIDFSPTITDYVFRSPSAIPVLDKIPDARSLEDDEPNSQHNIVTLCISDKKSIDKTLREAIISREGKKLEIISFIEPKDFDFREKIEKMFGCPMSQVIRNQRKLDVNETYRSLRHLR